MKITATKTVSVPTIPFNEIPGLGKSGRKYVILSDYSKGKFETVWVSTLTGQMVCFQSWSGERITILSKDIIDRDNSAMVDVSDMVKIEI